MGDKKKTKGKIAVIGLGYVGLPLAALCARRGYTTVGIDTNHDIVAMLNKGKIHIKDEVVEKSFSAGFATGNFVASTDPEDMAQCPIKIICVPTPVDEDHDPDLTPLLKATESVARNLCKGDIVIIESTIFPGTCEEYVLPILNSTGLVGGKDFHLAHCPERVNPGDVFWTTDNIPRVVGALTPEGTQRAANLYADLMQGEVFTIAKIRNTLRPKIIPDEKEGYRINKMPLGSVTMMNSIRDAEAVKAMENTVRDVNIAFVNELAKISDALHLNVIDIIEGMATKPFGKGPFYPGCGVGGHCIAVDPEWLKKASARAGYIPRMIELSRTTNNSMPEHTVQVLQDELNNLGKAVKGTKIAVLGVSYKGNVDDPRESPFYEVKHHLYKKGADIHVFDPWYTGDNTAKSLADALRGAKAALIITDHNEFRDTALIRHLKEHGVGLVIDGRNCMDAEAVRSSGIVYRGIGRR